jgi:hypothetical protein
MKTLRTLSAALYLALFTALPARAQTYDVVGLVMDSERGEPIGQVSVETKSGKVLGFTKSDGRFEVTVNSASAILVFKRNTYKDLELDLSDVTPEGRIGMEVTMEPNVLQLADKQVAARRGPGRDPGTGVSMEELENVQGMRIDLNDHLRQLPGVSGMGEFTNDISVFGGRTQDATHYLGQSRIPSLRHLDFGYPGNQSVLNPRLLKSITVADNLAKGPLNQGNSSALVYDLKDGDPNYIHGDLVFGTVNRELNLSGYWGGRTFLLSGRYLEPTFLSNLGEKFYTEPKEARLRRAGRSGCDSTKKCAELSDALDFLSGDLYVGTFYRDSTGAFGRHSLIAVDDRYEVIQDLSLSVEETAPQVLVKGTQDAWMYAYEGLSPYESGDLSYSLSLLSRKREETFRDTLVTTTDILGYPWFPRSAGRVDNLLAHNDNEELQTTVGFQWNSGSKLAGATWGWGLDLEYLGQEREFRDIGNNRPVMLPQDYGLANALLRLRWTLGSASSAPAADSGTPSAPARRPTLDASVGGATVYQGLLDGEDAGFKTAAPMASLRYTRPVTPDISGFGEVAVRQNTALEPQGRNRLEAVTTSSAEGKVGAHGSLLDNLHLTASVYSRLYKDPVLPVPEVHWNFEQARKSDYAYASGVNATVAWAPSHHFGTSWNATYVQGDYHLEDGGHLPWESNRTLDLVSNFRFLPRNDSLLSFIITYTAVNGAPLYEYSGLYANGASTNSMFIQPSRQHETVARQRTDMRINLDLPSKWRPLSNFRFFFEADNIFADAESAWFSWLGGDNERRRGWTRATPNGDLLPVVTRGMGLYIVFGFEGKLVI